MSEGTAPRAAAAPAPLDPALFAALAGAGAVHGGAAAQQYDVDGRSPRLAVRPSSLDALQSTLQEASTQGLAVILHGGGTSVAIGGPPQRYDLAVDIRALDAVVAYEPDDLTVTVQGGMRFGALQSLLAERGQFVPFDVAHAERATVGGALAAARAGPRRALYGSGRDWLIGCHVVLADGTLIKSGGRVVKNVSGYDLCKLFHGSYGTLGCIVEVSFKLRPLPAIDQTLLLSTKDFAAALGLGRRIAQEMNGLAAVVALDAQASVSMGWHDATVVVRAGGVERAVAAMLQAANAVVGAVAQPVPSDPKRWQAIADLEAAPPLGSGLVARCAVPPARLPDAAAALRAAAPDARLWAYADSGLIFAAMPAPTGVLLSAMAQTARAAIERLGGVMVVERAPAGEKRGIDVWGSPGRAIDIMRRVKEQFDPTHTLSPGRFVGGI